MDCVSRMDELPVSADYAVHIIATVQNTVLIHVCMYVCIYVCLNLCTCLHEYLPMYVCICICQYMTVMTIILLKL